MANKFQLIDLMTKFHVQPASYSFSQKQKRFSNFDFKKIPGSLLSDSGYLRISVISLKGTVTGRIQRCYVSRRRSNVQQLNLLRIISLCNIQSYCFCELQTETLFSKFGLT